MGEKPMRSRRCKGRVAGRRSLLKRIETGAVRRHCMNPCGKEPVMRTPEPEDLPFLRDYKGCGAQLFIIDIPKRGERRKNRFLSVSV